MKILLVDNYDSFTYNLYQYFGEVLGNPPTVVTNDTFDVIDDSEYDAVVISPGPGNPSCNRDFGISKSLIENTKKPLLGICLGHQGIVISEGGVVSHAPEPIHGLSYDVNHNGHRQFKDIPGRFGVIRYHSLVAQYPLPDSLEITATTDDGLVMAVAHRKKPIWGVQFHPESINTEYGKQIVRNFIDFAREVKKQANSERSFLDAANQTAPERWKCAYEMVKGNFVPAEVYEKLFDIKENGYWLDSGSDKAGYHFMGDAKGPNAFEVKYVLGQPIEIKDSSGSVFYKNEDIFSFVEGVIGEGIHGAEELPFNFTGGLVGYLGYELKQLIFPDKNLHSSSEPDACLMFSDRFVAINQNDRCIYLVGLYKTPTDKADTIDWIQDAKRKLSSAVSSRPSKMPNDALPISIESVPDVDFYLEKDRKQYIEAIAACKEHIRNGESYEICLTNRIKADVTSEPWQLYKTLRSVNPAPYSAFLRYDSFSVLSSSPERFLKTTKNGIVEAKPIKGTRPRNQNPEIDKALVLDLATDRKDRAENLMITDLLRNDLGRVCEIGSVWAPKLMHVESYETVHQLVSTIRGQLNEDVGLADIVKSTFPGGSMTGAPKRRTLTIIDELEGSPRGVYSGSIGYLSLNGTLDLNIVIRSLVCRKQSVEIGVGGAIIALSEPEAEYAEILVKGEAIMKSIAKYKTGRESGFKIIDSGDNKIDLDAVKEEFFFVSKESKSA
ncbi:para-aminobenzoate synthase component 1 [Rhodobacteraceae bacterium KLH11]|nr:para-aminobenzoate synthase component 1 [Rhodobacteraceae bacterium KLH11]